MSIPPDARVPLTENEVVSARVFAAPRARLVAVFVDPAQLAQWWGPAGFTNTIHEFDLCPGGNWRMTMHGPDGTNYPNHKIFDAVSLDQRVVFDQQGDSHRFRMTITWDEPAGDSTLMTWRMRFESAAELAQIKAMIIGANEQNFDRLAQFLGRLD